MVLMNAHVTFWGGGQLDTWRGLAHFVYIKRASFFDRRFPQPRSKVGGLSDVTNDNVTTPHAFEFGDKGLVVGVVQTLEILHCGIRTLDVFAANPANLIFCDRDSKQYRFLLAKIDPCRLQLFVKSDVRSANHDRVDDIWLTQLDFVDDRVELSVSKRVILLPNHSKVEKILNMLAGDLVGGSRPDVVRPDQEERLGVLFLRYPIEASQYLLSRLLARINDVGRLFESLVECRVVQHAVVLLEFRQHRLA